MSKYNSNLDFAKTLAIIGVVFLHISDGYLLRPDYFQGGLIWYLFFILRVLAGASVPLFVMTSGYCTIGKNYSNSQILQRVVVRLLIPFLVLFMTNTWIGGIAAAALYNTVLHTPLLSISESLIKIFAARGGLNFFIALIGLNLLLPVWSLVFSSSQDESKFPVAKYLIVMGFLVAFSISLNLNFNPDSPKTVLNEWRWLQWVGYFLLGYYLKIKPGFISKKQAVGIFLFGFISSGVMCLVARHQMLFNPDNNLFAQLANISLDYSAPGVVLMSIGSWLLLVRTNFLFLKKRIWQLVANVGASLSLGIYVFHGVVYLYLDVFRRLGLDNMIFWHRPAFALIGLTILTIMISALITFTLGLFPAFRMLIGNDKKWPFLSDIK